MNRTPNRNRSKVLLVVTWGGIDGQYGGPFNVAQDQAEIATTQDFHSTLFFTHDGLSASYRQHLRNYDIVSPIARPLIPRMRFQSTFSFAALKELAVAVHRSQIVHIALARELIPLTALVFAVLLRKAIIVQPHGMLTARSTAAHRLCDVALLQLVRRARYVLALTDDELSRLKDWLGRRNGAMPRMRVLTNPVPVAKHSFLDADRAVRPRREAIFVARLHPRKRVLDFAVAATIQRDDIAYVVYGPDEGDLTALEKAANHEPRLAYRGSLPSAEVSSRLAESGVFVMPSRNEPWGLVLVAALSLGKPVVITASANLAADVVAFKAGRVVADDCPAEIAAAVSELLNDEATYIHAARGAYHLATSLRERQNTNDALLEIYSNSIRCSN